MKMVYKNFNNIHPLLRAMLAYSDYDHDDRENVISCTSIMKPTQMVALERSNKSADRAMDIEGMIPSVGGTALHNHLESALNNTDDETWKGIGVSDPGELEIITEVREETPIGDHIVSGKFDVLFRYKASKWQLADMKSMSVWGIMIDKKGKLEEFCKQMSIYRYLNQDKDIDDIAVVLTWFTDWSKSDAVIKAKQGYPQSRIGVEMVNLWSLDQTKIYLETKERNIVIAMQRYAKSGNKDTGSRCSDEELWMKKSGWAYYSKAGAKRATKVVDSFDQAEELRLKAKDPTAFVEERKPKATRCNYCAVTDFCPQYAEHIVKGMV